MKIFTENTADSIINNIGGQNSNFRRIKLEIESVSRFILPRGGLSGDTFCCCS